jgi:hypothetical protein
MTLLEQSPLWLIPFALLMLFMVHAMVQFVLSLMVKRPAARRLPASAAKLRTRLEGINAADRPYRLAAGRDWDYELKWQVVDSDWRQRFARVRLTSIYRARLLLDEAHREVRLQEHLRSNSFFLGFQGWMPRIHWRWSAYWGPVTGHWSGRVYGVMSGLPPQIGEVTSFTVDTDAPKEEIMKIAHKGGWAVRPVILQYQISRKWQRRLQRITPGALLRLSDRRFWGLVYPGSYLAGFVYLFLISGRELLAPGNLALVLGISAAWWGMWGLLTWALVGMPGRRKRRGSGKAP